MQRQQSKTAAAAGQRPAAHRRPKEVAGPAGRVPPAERRRQQLTGSDEQQAAPASGLGTIVWACYVRNKTEVTENKAEHKD